MKWSFIEATLRAMGIPGLFVTWIMRFVDTTMFLVSINGDLEVFFPSSRGIRQGCSLSLYLYVIVSNVLLQAFQIFGVQLFAYHKTELMR